MSFSIDPDTLARQRMLEAMLGRVSYQEQSESSLGEAIAEGNSARVESHCESSANASEITFARLESTVEDRR